LINDPDLVLASGKSCWESAIWFWMTPENYGGWCMPQAAWPHHDQCSAHCPKGPHKCKARACTKNHWIKEGAISPHDAMTSSKGKGMS